MKYFRSRYNSACELIEGYVYPEPFHIAAKNFFKKSKKFGSKDRKAIAEICYTYFRSGLIMSELDSREGVLISALLIDFEYAEEWNRVSEESGYSHKISHDFFENGNVVDTIKQFCGEDVSFYPKNLLMDDFLHYNDAVNLKFRPKNWAKDHTDKEERNLGVVGCLELAVNQKLESTIQVQDLSSQYICSKIAVEDGDKVWDVCSGAGGKSMNLMASGNGQYYLSDIRSGILQNAKSRLRSMHYDASFAEIDISKPYRRLTFDGSGIDHDFFDVIVADVPCSGSGTWFRTPEHFTRFDYNKLEEYAQRQKSIVTNALPFLTEGGVFYYITCSVFKKENEEVRDWILENHKLTVVDEVIFDGLRQRADGMYMVGFKK